MILEILTRETQEIESSEVEDNLTPNCNVSAVTTGPRLFYATKTVTGASCYILILILPWNENNVKSVVKTQRLGRVKWGDRCELNGAESFWCWMRLRENWYFEWWNSFMCFQRAGVRDIQFMWEESILIDWLVSKIAILNFARIYLFWIREYGTFSHDDTFVCYFLACLILFVSPTYCLGSLENSVAFQLIK